MRLRLINLYEVKKYTNTINQVNFRNNIFLKNWILVLYVISKTNF